MPLTNVLTLSRKLILFDLETTSTDTREARILQIAFKLFQPDGSVTTWQALIDPGVPIPAASIKVHGITQARLEECRKCSSPPADWKTVGDCEHAPTFTFVQVARNLASGFSDCDYAGKNIRYDLEVLRENMARVNVPWTYEGASIVCADAIERLANPRDLSTLHEKYTGRKLEHAHDAMHDVEATEIVLCAQLAQHPSLPRTPDKLHDASWPNQADMTGKFRLDADGTLRFNFGKHRGIAVKDAPRGYVDWFLGSDFPADAKAMLVKHR